MSVTRTSSTSAKGRDQNPRGQGDRLRYDLLNAAVDLIAEEGSVDRVSLRAVAARAGVSPTAVYRHFDNANELLGDAVVHCWESFDDALETVADPDSDPFSEFRQLGTAYASFAAENPGQYRAMFSIAMSTTDATMLTKFKGASLGVFAKLVERVEIMLDQNRDERDPVFVATQVHTWIHGIVDVCNADDDNLFPSADELLDDLVVRLGLTRRLG
jgi:AcrR family transcriptional regulator